MKHIYFAGSIRGGRVDAELYARIIAYLKKDNKVFTEHIGSPKLFEMEEGQTDADIYQQDTNWLRQSHLLIAECTSPSLGVGYELAYAEQHQKPIYIFYNKTKTQLSAMLAGNPYNKIFPYTAEEEIYPLLDKILSDNL